MATVATLTAVIEADTSNFDAGVEAANQKLQELGKSGQQAGQQAGRSIDQMADGFNAAGKLMMAGGAAMLAPMVDAVRGAASLQQAMDSVGVAFGVVEGQSAEMDAQFQEMEDTINEVASSTIFGAEDVAKAAIEMGKAGVDFETTFGDIGDASDGALQGVADFAAATATQLPTAAKIASTMANQWGMSTEDMTASLDDLTTVFNTTSLGAEDFLGGMANIAPMMKLANADFAETAATLGFFVDQGLSAREAGTSLTAMLRAAVKPTETQQAAMDQLGITTEDFFQINEQGIQELRDFPDILDTINEKTQGLDTATRLAALANLFGLEAFDAAGLGILSNTDLLRDLNEEMENNTGIARKQSEALTDNLLGAIEELGGSYDVLKSKMGDPFLDPLQAGVEGVTDLVDALAEADPAVQRFASKMLGVGGSLLTFGGLAAYGTGQVLDLAQQFSKAGLSLPKFAAGLGLVGLAIGAGLLAYENDILGFRGVVDGAMDRATRGVNAFGESLNETANTDMNDFERAAVASREAIDASLGAGGQMGDMFDGIGASARNAADAVGDWIDSRPIDESLTTGETPALVDFFNNLGKGIAESGEAADTATPLLNGMFDSLGSHISEIGSLDGTEEFPLVRFFNALGLGVQELGKNLSTVDIGGGLQHISDQMTGWLNDTSRELLGGFDTLAGPGERQVEGAIPKLAQDIADNFGLSLETLPSLMTDKLASIPNPFEGVQQWLQEGMDEITRFFMPQEMAAGLGGAGMGDTSGINQMFSGVVEGIGAGMDQAVADLGALAEEKKTGFKNALGDFFGPIGQFLFPSEDAAAAPLGDPADLGKQFGESLIDSFTDPQFVEGLNTAIDSLPKETFMQTGAALLGAINDGMETALLEQGPGAASESGAGTSPIGGGMGQQMIRSIADGLTTSFQSIDPQTFVPVAAGMLGAIDGALMTAMQGAPKPSGLSEGTQAGKGLVGGVGQQMVQSLATGLQTSIADAPPEIFTPVATALGTQLATALQTASQATQAPGPTGVPTQVPGFGQQMVQGLATGLTDSITAAPAEMFVPVTGALGAKLGEAMSMAAQPVQPVGGVGPVDPASGVGTSMVQGLATGLADSITATPVEVFHPVSNALGAKLGESLQTAMTQTVGVGENAGGGRVGAEAAGGIGTQMVQGLATGMADSITAAPIETFAPVGSALGTKLGEALQAAVESGAQGAGGGTGGDTAGIGMQMGEAVGQMLISGVEQADFTPVGTSLSQKIGETLQTVAEGGGELDISEQVGTSVGQMLQSGIESADFSGVGESLTTQLSDQLTSAIDEVSSQIEEAMNGITEAISEAVSQMGEAIGEATEQVSQAVEDMSASIEDATSAVSDAVSEMQSAVEEAGSAMEEAAQAAADAASEVGDAAAEAAEAVSSAMQEMAAAVQSAAGAIEGAAGQIIAALNSIAGAAAAAGAAIGSALAGGFSNSLGIQSPSKVFLGFGKNIVEGLAIGMGGNNQIVSRGSNALAKQSMSTLANAIGMGSPAKKFMPHGAAITQGMLAGMIQEAKGRMQSAMGQMAGAVESGMGKVKSAMASGMERVRSQGQQEASAMGAETATAAAEGMTSEERAAERAARRLWRRAYRELMNGVGAARFLGESWAREFWEGMLDSGGSLEFAQFVTQQIVGAAEDAVMAAAGAVKGLATQLQIVGDEIGTLESEISSLESQLAGIDQQIAAQAQQERLRAVQDELTAQREITRELQARLKTEVSAAHAAHIRAVQTRSAAAQADYEHKLRTAQATNTAIAESAAREEQLTKALAEMQAAIAQAARDELALRRTAIAEELAMKRQALAEEMAMQAQLLAQQAAAQMQYSQAVIEGSQDRIKQLRKELRDASGAEQRRTIQAQIALEEQRIALAQQLATALQGQNAAQGPEAMAQAAAQVQFLSEQIAALGEVDVASLLSGIVSDLGEAASTMSSAASDMSSAADAMGSMEAAAPVQAATKAAAEFGTEAAVAERGMFSMANAYDKVMADMNADGEAFQAQFAAMVQKTAGDAAAGGANIGDALSTGITGRIQAGGKATQDAMVQHLNGAVDETTGEAVKGADTIATEFGTAMRGQMGTELSSVHQQVLNGMTKATDDAATEAAKGGTDMAQAYGQSSTDKLKDELPKFQTAMSQGLNDTLRDSKNLAAGNGKTIGDAMGDGLKSGIENKSGIVAGAVKKLVNDAFAAGKQAADSNSPSKKFMDLGDDMGLGLVLGLRGRTGDAEEASARLVHIPLSPTSAGGVTGRRAMQERRGATTQHITIEHLELPGVTNPREFIEVLDRWAAANGVASGR